MILERRPAPRFPGDKGGPIGLGGSGKPSEPGTAPALWPYRMTPTGKVWLLAAHDTQAWIELWHRTRPMDRKMGHGSN